MYIQPTAALADPHPAETADIDAPPREVRPIDAVAFPQAATEAGDFKSFFRRFPEYLIKDAVNGRDVLDLGCGYGGRTVEYKILGAKSVCGIEPFDNMIALAREYADNRGVDVDFKVCGHRDIPYPDASFDIVVTYDVLEHVADPRVTFREIERVLRPGGLSINIFPLYFGASSHHLDYLTTMPGLHWFIPAGLLMKGVNWVLARRPEYGMPPQPMPKRSFDGRHPVLPNLNGLSSRHFPELFKPFEVISIERQPALYWKPRLRPLAGSIARTSGLPLVLRDAMTNSLSCILRKPGPAETVPLHTVRELAATSLPPSDWSLFAPARLDGERIVIDGKLEFPHGYAATSATYHLPAGARIVLTGEVKRGGLALGLLDAQDQWASLDTVLEGRFDRIIDVPAEGEYRVVIANNVVLGPPMNQAVVDRVGLVGLDPTALRVAGADAPSEPALTREDIADLPLSEIPGSEWTLVAPAATEDGQLVVRGAPAFPAGYAAVSAPHRLEAGGKAAVAGEVREGGISVGLLTEADQWAAPVVAVRPGAFGALVEAPEAGLYRLVISNNLSEGQARNDVLITRAGFVADA